MFWPWIVLPVVPVANGDVVVMFGAGGVVRLADGRIARGLADLAIALAFIAAYPRMSLIATGQAEGPERRARWVAERPVIGALVAGSTWGAAMTVFFILTGGPILLAAALGLGGGLLFFGPGVVLLSRRYRRPLSPPVGQ